MKKEKWLSLILAGVMIVSCFAGCSGGSAGGGENAGGKTTIQVKYWVSGLGSEWLENVIAGFEKKYPQYKVKVDSSSTPTALTSALGYEDTDTTDLYLCTKDYNLKGCLEPLDDVLNAKAEGESKTIGEKFDESYLKLEQSEDGHYYNLTYGGGLVGIYYNKKMFEEAGITQEPRTTDELVVACDTLYADGKKAFCHFKPVGYWEDYMGDVFFTQYDGLDYVLNNFYGCTDEAGNSPSLEVFTKEDGRYEALKVMAKICTPEYTMTGSNTYDHTTVQTMWLQGEAAMMVNGTWIGSEMSSVEGIENITMMKTPVISSIVEKLTTVKTDKDLRTVVTAIDEVTEGKKEESEYKQGDDYVVDGLAVSAADWAYIRAARNTMAMNATGTSLFIPTYADAKEGAKEFLKYLYSDEGYKIYANTLQETLPLSLDSGELDISDWSELAQKQVKIFNETEQFISMYNAGKHKIFSEGGARWKSFATTYCNRFSSSNTDDRMTAAEAWADTLQYAKDNYETNWLANIK
jgi:ABC-type glycerol-3-phosphate transport system substrate-binding protein